MNPSQRYRIEVNKDVTDCIVFWTKDPKMMMEHLDELDSRGFMYYFQYTITPYDLEIEKNLRPKEELMDTFIKLSERIGKERVVWRYDPILLNDQYTIERHRVCFERMADRLADYTDMVTISFVDQYVKHRKRFRTVESGEAQEISSHIVRIASHHGMQVTACCENERLLSAGVEMASCIDPRRIEQICGVPMNLRKDKNQRTGCGCCESVDIGVYNSCLNGCAYCYANTSLDAAKRNYERHQADSVVLIGGISNNEQLHEKPVESNKQRQISLFDGCRYS